VLDWDAATDSVTPSSLHSFEGEASLRCGRSVCAQAPRALADPQVRHSGAGSRRAVRRALRRASTTAVQH